MPPKDCHLELLVRRFLCPRWSAWCSGEEGCDHSMTLGSTHHSTHAHPPPPSLEANQSMSPLMLLVSQIFKTSHFAHGKLFLAPGLLHGLFPLSVIPSSVVGAFSFFSVRKSPPQKSLSWPPYFRPFFSASPSSYCLYSYYHSQRSCQYTCLFVWNLCPHYIVSTTRARTLPFYCGISTLSMVAGIDWGLLFFVVWANERGAYRW